MLSTSRAVQLGGCGTITVRGLMHAPCSHGQQYLAGLQWLLAQIEAARIAAP